MTDGGSQFRFCPECGGPLARRSITGDEQPRLRCDRCGFIFYENSKPCAGALVVQDGRVLLARRAVQPFLGHWDIPGGFLENGEHPLDGARRELREETGLDIHPHQLLGIYVDRYDDGPYTLNIYYLAEVVGGTPRPASDVSTLTWFGPEELPEPMAFAHCRQVLADWRDRCHDPKSSNEVRDEQG